MNRSDRMAGNAFIASLVALWPDQGPVLSGVQLVPDYWKLQSDELLADVRLVVPRHFPYAVLRSLLLHP